LLAIAWLAGRGSRSRAARAPLASFVRAIALAPPLVQSIGLLALPWLAGLAAAFLLDLPGWRPLANVLGAIAAGFDPVQNSWLMLSCGVGLALLTRFLWCWPGGARNDSPGAAASSARDAALLAGGSRWQGVRLSEPSPRGRWLGRFLLAWAFAATNVAPALLFEPWSDGQTVGPASLALAAGPPEARSRAAALALGAIAVNLAALAIARATSALPRRVDLE
jgi:hypothetical protein